MDSSLIYFRRSLPGAPAALPKVVKLASGVQYVDLRTGGGEVRTPGTVDEWWDYPPNSNNTGWCFGNYPLVN